MHPTFFLSSLVPACVAKPSSLSFRFPLVKAIHTDPKQRTAARGGAPLRTCELWARHCCAPDSRAPPPHDAQHFLVVASRSRLCLFLTKNRCRLTRMRASHYSSFSDTLLSLPSSSTQPLPGGSGLLRPSYLPYPFTIFLPGSGLALLASLLRSRFLGGPASLTLAPPTLARSSSFCELPSSTEQAHGLTGLAFVSFLPFPVSCAYRRPIPIPP